MARTVDLLQGTLDLMILKALTGGRLHGYAAARWIQEVTADVLHIEEGSLYPALHRLEEREWITAEWGLSENNRRAKYYHLTARGRRQLQTEVSAWGRFALAVSQVIAASPPITA